MDLKLDSILKWAIENGSTIDPLLNFQISPDRGIYATYDKTLTEPSLQPQLEIPINLILTNVLSNEYFGKEIETGNPNSSLKLLLCKLKYDNNWKDDKYQKKFKPYVDLLPVGTQTGSIFYWTEEELKLLDNTNLGGSIDLKLESLLREWYDSILQLPKEYKTEQFIKDAEFYNEFHRLPKNEVVVNLLNSSSWTSFGAYVWSSYIFTSRAFPNHIINNKVKDGQAILLPVIDLLNHNNSTRIQWNHTVRDNNEFFSLQNIDLLQKGEEIFNNYGAKGNEELLMGYGFVIEDNQNNSIALRIKLPIEILIQAKESGIKIPKIDDYTYHSFHNQNQIDENSDISEDEIRDGLLYFINESNLVPDNLLSLFQFLVKKPNENKETLRSKFQALQNLKQALEQKEKLLRKEISSDSINENKARLAKIYRKDQQRLYKSSINEIKSIEKSLLHEYKSYVLNLKKLYKKDTQLQELLDTQLHITNYDTIEAEDMIDAVYFIWLIMHGEELNVSEYKAPQWIIKLYKELKSNSKEINDDFKSLQDFLQEHFKGTALVSQLNKKNISIANQVLNNNSYMRLNTSEIILVEPFEL